MKKNIGSIDRVARVGVALVIGILYLTNVITGTAAVISGLVAVIFALTSLVGTCPLYLLFGLTTNKEEKASA